MFLGKGTLIIIGLIFAIGGFYAYDQQQKNQPLSNLPKYEAVSGKPAELPKLAPEDFSVYPGAEVIRMETNPQSDFAAGFASRDTPQKVFAFLLENAEKKGWQIIEQKGLIFRSTKGKITITISVSQNPGEKTAILEQVKFAK